MNQERWRILVLLGGSELFGQERANIEVIDSLVKATGADCLFVTNSKWGRKSIEPELERRGLRWTTAPYCGLLGYHLSAMQWLQRIVEIIHSHWALVVIFWRYNPTHIHIGNPLHFLTFMGVLLLTNTPIVYRMGDAPLTHHAMWRWTWRRMVERINIFVCNCRFLEKELRLFSGRIRACRVIYSKPRVPAERLSKPCWSEQKPHPTMFCFVGQPSRHKGVDLFVGAIARTRARDPGVGACIAGDSIWGSDIADLLRDGSTATEFANRTAWLRHVEDVHALLTACSVHVCPSVVDDPLPNVILEAKQAGIPSIVFPKGGMPEVVRHGVDGYVCSQPTQESLEEAIWFYIEHPEEAKRQGQAARQSLALLDVDRFAERWHEAYHFAEHHSR